MILGNLLHLYEPQSSRLKTGVKIVTHRVSLSIKSDCVNFLTQDLKLLKSYLLLLYSVIKRYITVNFRKKNGCCLCVYMCVSFWT